MRIQAATAATTEGQVRLAEQVARHLGTTLIDGVMPCPVCGGDYGPTVPLSDLAYYELSYLPGAPLLVGVCLDCSHVHEPPVRHYH
jgi:hypothetical protein